MSEKDRHANRLAHMKATRYFNETLKSVPDLSPYEMVTSLLSESFEQAEMEDFKFAESLAFIATITAYEIMNEGLDDIRKSSYADPNYLVEV